MNAGDLQKKRISEIKPDRNDVFNFVSAEKIDYGNSSFIGSWPS
jgi:hypothetical protein